MFSFPPWARFPSVSLPTTIQRRFLSFVLKRSLGHLVKPGQLDPAQIDAQIGSGFVQVNDVELDHDAINVHLADLPFPFVLEAGSIGKVAARIPWPNLTAPLALSLSSVSLTFVHYPRSKATPHPFYREDDLTGSVASMAESFIHDELSSRETEILRESIHVNPPSRRQPPGYMDPFLSTEDLDSGQRAQEFHQDDDGKEDEIDPSTQGISIIATLMERLLARFEFDVSDICIRAFLPGKAEFIIRIDRVAYGTEGTSDPSESTFQKGVDDGEVRLVNIRGISVSTRDLAPAPLPTSTVFRERSISPINSDGEEEGDVVMSQSLASLPPRSSTHSTSPESTMYHSATSSMGSFSPEIIPEILTRDPVEETILSLGQGSEPVIFKLVTPRLVVPSVPVVSETPGNVRPGLLRNTAGAIRLTITIGPLAVAINPIHARSLFHLYSVLAESRSPQRYPNASRPASATKLEFALHAKSATLLFLQSPSFLPTQCARKDLLEEFFFAHTSSHPRIPHLRVQFDGLEVLSPTVTSADSRQKNVVGFDHANRDKFPHLLKASLADFSVFAFAHRGEQGWAASPIVCSDPNLGLQYAQDVKFPVLDVMDWTNSGDTSKAGKVSHWRVRLSHNKRKPADNVSSAAQEPANTSPLPALQVCHKLHASKRDAVCEVDIVPLHLFVDVGMVDGALDFLKEMTASNPSYDSEDIASGLDLEETPPSTPRAVSYALRNEKRDINERERRRLEDLIINDFTKDPEVCPIESVDTGTSFVLRVTLLRIEARVPPPTPAAKPRSGAVVLDLHEIQVKVATPMEHAEHDSYDGGREAPKVLGRLELKRVLAAASLPGEAKASAFLSGGTQVTSQLLPATFGIPNPGLARSHPAVSPHPSICLRANPVVSRLPSTIATGAALSFSLDAHFPAVNLTLSKATLDGLTFWADDITQCLFCDVERTSTSGTGRSRDPSMIGSRFFAKRTASSGSSENGLEARKSEFVAKVSIGEVQMNLLVPRKDENGMARPLDVKAFDVDFLAEIKPEGKDETVVTLGVMDIRISDSSAKDAIPILGLTIPREVIAPSRSLLKLRYVSVIDNDTTAKESRLRLTISDFTYFLTPEIAWITDLALFAKAPEGAFETVIPSERTKVSVKITDGSFHVVGPNRLGALVIYIGEIEFSTDLVGDSHETVFSMTVTNSYALFIDDTYTSTTTGDISTHSGVEYWKQLGYALVAEVDDLGVRMSHRREPIVNTQVNVDSIKVKLHACADTIPAIGSFTSSVGSTFYSSAEEPSPRVPTATSLSTPDRRKQDVFASVDEHAFKGVLDLGPAPDMVGDDLPTNLDYLDASFGAAAGLRELRDDDLFDFESDKLDLSRNTPVTARGAEGLISNLGGETIRMLDPQGIHFVEGYFENIPQEPDTISSGSSDDARMSIRVRNCDLTISLYEGYDWARTRKTIDQKVKAIRRRLVKIRQLLANGQTPDDSIEETSAILFNSVSVGLPLDSEELEPGALIAAIDEELDADATSDRASQTSWQSFKPRSQHTAQKLTRLRGRKLERSKGSQIDFCLSGVQAEVDQFHSNAPLVSRILITVKILEILDHIRTSTWNKFLTELRTDFRGNTRETGSDMVRGELRIVHPVPDLPSEEARLRAKILPIKLHVDQDALDFIKNFFSFQDRGLPIPSDIPKTELYFQHVEVFPVDIKLDYKPKRVDYKALREGKTIELMNFFHFDGAEITLRHITLSGITGWPRLFDNLNDLWTPDVKANQLADIISGVSPVRSLVNVGSGVADLVLLPIAQYKKDKHVVRGVQKGTTSFVRSTAMEAIKLGARLATGTQVILEQAETVLGGQGQFKDTVTAEALQAHVGSSDEESEVDFISKYADQPQDVREGMQSAYRSLSKNFNSAAQTILAVPMEVYERSGHEGPVRAIVRAVPIAVLKPMIGASEAVSKTLFGLRNTMDPEVKYENENKYKQR
ncbi:hypothetical protein K439DRAFT_1657242 [Ramaria rubella]|nr:hypothetical protein K439DRAFT_1657242 [Ramaria rubella]